jgi:hypothetical protein
LVSVDFADLLEITLPYNRHHFGEVIVVTSTRDKRSREIAEDYGAAVYETDSFYEPGAMFNKHKPLEEALDAIGRRGWLCMMDVDILWPKIFPHFELEVGNLYGPGRKVMVQPSKVIPDDWSNFPSYLPNSKLIAGYSQLFHADDPYLGNPPWHRTNWRHAGGADTYFQLQWPRPNRIRLPFDVLHLGKVGVNWCGRTTPYLDGSYPPRAEENMSQLLRMVRRPGYPRRGAHERY